MLQVIMALIGITLRVAFIAALIKIILVLVGIASPAFLVLMAVGLVLDVLFSVLRGGDNG